MIEYLSKCLIIKQLRNTQNVCLFPYFDSNTLKYNKLNKQ